MPLDIFLLGLSLVRGQNVGNKIMDFIEIKEWLSECIKQDQVIISISFYVRLCFIVIFLNQKYVIK